MQTNRTTNCQQQPPKHFQTVKANSNRLRSLPNSANCTSNSCDVPDSVNQVRTQVDQRVVSPSSCQQDNEVPQETRAKNGRDGMAGLDGRDGRDGRNGVDGRPGERGFQGLQGIAGETRIVPCSNCGSDNTTTPPENGNKNGNGNGYGYGQQQQSSQMGYPGSQVPYGQGGYGTVGPVSPTGYCPSPGYGYGTAPGIVAPPQVYAQPSPVITAVPTISPTLITPTLIPGLCPNNNNTNGNGNSTGDDTLGTGLNCFGYFFIYTGTTPVTLDIGQNITFTRSVFRRMYFGTNPSSTLTSGDVITINPLSGTPGVTGSGYFDININIVPQKGARFALLINGQQSTTNNFGAGTSDQNVVPVVGNFIVPMTGTTTLSVKVLASADGEPVTLNQANQGGSAVGTTTGVTSFQMTIKQIAYFNNSGAS